jgi:hypothetical protein
MASGDGKAANRCTKLTVIKINQDFKQLLKRGQTDGKLVFSNVPLMKY